MGCDGSEPQRFKFVTSTVVVSSTSSCSCPLLVILSAFCSSDAKRLIGRRFDDPAVTADRKHWPFEVINDGSKPKIQVEYKAETKSFYPEEVSIVICSKMYIIYA